MNEKGFHKGITCAYLYTISRYGYPPDIGNTLQHISEMAMLGFRSIELEGIGQHNIEYLRINRDSVKEALAKNGCKLPVLCLVLPELSSTDISKRANALEMFESGCDTARFLGASAVLDNGPLLPVARPENAPVQRHYSADSVAGPVFKNGFDWKDYQAELVVTYRNACSIAAKYGLTYHMHPCEGSLITGTDAFLHFADAVGAPNLMFNLDTANQFYFHDNLAFSVLRLKDRINYIHISDNGGTRVEHTVPGQGKINWDLFFDALQQTGFSGHLAIDVGGAETGIGNIDEAYTDTANWLNEQIALYSLNLVS